MHSMVEGADACAAPTITHGLRIHRAASFDGVCGRLPNESPGADGSPKRLAADESGDRTHVTRAIGGYSQSWLMPSHKPSSHSCLSDQAHDLTRARQENGKLIERDA
jgi:hypothetical protein